MPSDQYFDFVFPSPLLQLLLLTIMNPENKQLVIEAVELFVQHYGVKPEVAVFAPGRVNLIGEHTDYNDGWVLPFAIPFITVIVGTRTKDNVSRVSSTYCKTVEPVEFKVDKHLGKGVPTWCNYVKG
jgi:galactokinase